jgi:hypothetical protein
MRRFQKTEPRPTISDITRYSVTRAHTLGFAPSAIWATRPRTRSARYEEEKRARALIVRELRGAESDARRHRNRLRRSHG